MADAEFTVSSGEHMRVKEEEGESSGNHYESKVILHLKPILQGINDGIANTGTTVMAIETHDDGSRAEGEETEYGYPITCGNNRAVLLFKKFVCPGINVRCVKFNDQLISPKQFVHLAGKATLKDWKRAIRLGGVMLRKMMDSGQIDFYQHDTVCNNTCRSTKFDVLINSSRPPPGTSVLPSSSCLALDPLGGQVPPLTGRRSHDTGKFEERLQDTFSATAEGSPGPALSVNRITANGHAAKRESSDGVLSLWKGVANAGLMRCVLSGLQTELLATLKGVEVRSEKACLQETDAIILNSLCEMFGLLDSVKQALDLKRSQNQENKAQNSVNVLSEITEEQRKQGFDKNSSKHFRPQRHDPSNRRSQSVMSPVKSSPVFQPLSIAGFSAASYAQLSLSPELFTHFSTLAACNHHSRASSVTLMHEHCDARSQEKPYHLGHQGVKIEDTSVCDREIKLRTAEFAGHPYHRSEEVEETDGLCDSDMVNIERKASKKHKSQ